MHTLTTLRQLSGDLQYARRSIVNLAAQRVSLIDAVADRRSEQCRTRARGLEKLHAAHIHALLGRLTFVELARPVLERAILPFATAVRTLDALPLASILFLREQGQTVRLASYDARLVAAAKRMTFATVSL
jgi:hypothetical protein